MSEPLFPEWYWERVKTPRWRYMLLRLMFWRWKEITVTAEGYGKFSMLVQR